MTLLYRVFSASYYAAIRLAAPFNKRARAWCLGRKNWKEVLRKELHPHKGAIWMHCASLGEFEQGRPVLERIRERYPSHPLVLSFFSPSGFEARKNWEGVDAVFYLPEDRFSNARELMALLEPQLVLWVKYEFWMGYLHTFRKNQTPAILFSAVFRENHYFKHAWAGWFRKGLKAFDPIFVQDEASLALANSMNLQAQLGGDTRFDRVVQIAEASKAIEPIRQFCDGRFCVVAGSSWEEEEKLLARYLDGTEKDFCLIIVPHQVDPEHIKQIEALYGKASLRLSDPAYNVLCKDADKQVLIVDQMGLLSRIYQYADLAVIGGGFGAGIHNTLEAAVYGIPVLFGPRFDKFKEAHELIAAGAGLSFDSFEALRDLLHAFRADASLRQQAGQAASHYVKGNTGASEKVMQAIAKVLN